MRQYIGARYVPQFFDDGHGSAEWAGDTVSYEALTVVTHLGNSFTSKKPVPTGIDINNTDYWASTGIWNAQVEEYRQEVQDLSADFKNKLGNLVTPEDFGAVGDSTTDDTEAVQAALDSGKGVLLKSYYLIKNTLTFSNYAYIIGMGSHTGLINGMNTGNAILYCDDVNAHFTIENFLIHGNDLNCKGIKVDNPYDDCNISNVFFLSMVNTAIECGSTSVSQGLHIDNCNVWCSADNAASGTHPMAKFTSCNEFNINNTKFLFNGVQKGSTHCLEAVNCYDMNIIGCSFANTTDSAIYFSGSNSRYCRIIGNTYEIIDGGTNSAIIELVSDTADGIQNFMIIEQPYYNCPANVYNTNSTQNIIIGLNTTGGRRNLAINNKGGADAYNNMNLKIDGNTLLADKFDIAPGGTAKHLLQNDSNDCLYISDQTHSTAVTIGNGWIENYKNGGGLKLRDSNGVMYYVLVDTDGTLKVVHS